MLGSWVRAPSGSQSKDNHHSKSLILLRESGITFSTCYVQSSYPRNGHSKKNKKAMCPICCNCMGPSDRSTLLYTLTGFHVIHRLKKGISLSFGLTLGYGNIHKSSYLHSSMQTDTITYISPVKIVSDS